MCLLTTLTSSGWLVNNAYQHDDGSWRVNLRHESPEGTWFTNWSEGPTLEDALEDCMQKIQSAELVETEGSSAWSIDQSAAPSLLTRLGLGRKAQPIIRRV